MLEKEITTHANALAWEIPWTEETGRLQSIGSQRVGRDEQLSCSVVSNSLPPHGLYSPWNSPGQNTRVGCLSLLQGIFPTQGSSRGLLHCWQIFFFTNWANREGHRYIYLFMRQESHHGGSTFLTQSLLSWTPSPNTITLVVKISTYGFLHKLSVQTSVK